MSVPEEKSAGTIAYITIDACANGVKVVFETKRAGLSRFLGPDTTEYVARDLPDLEMVFQRILGNEKVAAALSRCFEGNMAAR